MRFDPWQVFYGVTNVYSRIKGRKIDEMFDDEDPPLPNREAALSLQMCNMSGTAPAHFMVL